MADYRVYKFLIVPVLQKLDEQGEVVGELVAENPTTVFGLDGLRLFAENFELELAAKLEEIPSG